MLPNESDLTPAGEFQARFGAPPGSQDPQADCAQWEQLCAELLSERSQLQAELGKARAESNASFKALYAAAFEGAKVEMPMELLFAHVDRTTSLDQLIAELEREAESE